MSSSRLNHLPFLISNFFPLLAVTTYGEWTSKGTRSYDMAVIKYWPDSNNRLIGDRIGYAGWQSVKHGSDSKLDSDYIRGYPYNKPDGTLWRSGTCNHWCYRRFLGICTQKHMSKLSCEAYKAMSGSAVMSSSGYVHGILVAETSSYKIAVLLYGRNVDKFRQWAGR